MTDPRAAGPIALNVLGEPLQPCCHDPLTGFYRDGFCRTGKDDVGVHTVCALLTEEFLNYSKAAGNDLSTPRPEFNFPGLVPGDQWCLCASRWLQAHQAGCAPRVRLQATHIRTLDLVDLADLKRLAIDLS